VVLLTVIEVAPTSAFVINVVDAATPPDPVTAVTCVPVLTPVPPTGDPIGGGLPVNPIVSRPD
jgi:hypothetical protein